MENDESLRGLGARLVEALPGQVTAFRVAHHELMVDVSAADIVDIMTFLRDDAGCLFRELIDVTAVDYPERPQRFEVVYNLLSLRHNRRIRAKVACAEDAPVPSVVEVFPVANWFEREVWDMYGIMFSGHPDLRRILTDYGFEGHPLRKDFPLTGFVELRYDEAEKRVVYDPVTLTQEFRTFDFLSPWECMTRVLPGDEKAGKGE